MCSNTEVCWKRGKIIYIEKKRQRSSPTKSCSHSCFFSHRGRENNMFVLLLSKPLLSSWCSVCVKVALGWRFIMTATSIFISVRQSTERAVRSAITGVKKSKRGEAALSCDAAHHWNVLIYSLKKFGFYPTCLWLGSFNVFLFLFFCF